MSASLEEKIADEVLAESQAAVKTVRNAFLFVDLRVFGNEWCCILLLLIFEWDRVLTCYRLMMRWRMGLRISRHEKLSGVEWRGGGQ